MFHCTDRALSNDIQNDYTVFPRVTYLEHVLQQTKLIQISELHINSTGHFPQICNF